MVNKKKKILIIGSGAREHALGWKLNQSPQVSQIYFAPGTAATAKVGENTNINPLDFKTLTKFAKDKKIDLTVAGPDDVLAAGIVNAFQKMGLKIFGATQEASQIESSKAFAKQLMREEKIPTAKYEAFTDPKKAIAYVKKNGTPIVIKASGLALGKGVVIAHTLKQANKAIEDSMVKKVFGASGEEIVIEEFLQGNEVSIHVFTDGETIAMLPPSRDHKPIFDGNKGPNTGGMGTIAPLPEISKKEIEIIKKKIIIPVINGLKKRGMPFTGCLYPGLIMTNEGPKVIEFNCRFGDPETESYVRILKTDLYDILLACAENRLKDIKIKWSKKSACCIIIASAGYPAGSHKGDVIYGIENAEKNSSIEVFHFATKIEGDKMVTNSGRVLGITATGKDLNEALKNAYFAIGKKGIHFRGMQYRKDIGKIK